MHKFCNIECSSSWGSQSQKKVHMLIKKWMTIALDLVTPAFISGAHPRQVDQHMPLRPSSVRGVLRYWFRAAVAPRLDWGDRQLAIDKLREIETDVFGSTEKASPIVLLPPRSQEITPLIGDFPPPDRNRNRGQRYLGYGLFEDRGNNPSVLYPPENGTSSITLRFALRGDDLDGLSEVFGATIWLWAHLGGIGARSRRGWGSFRLREVTMQKGDFPFDLSPPEDRDALLGRLETGLREVDERFDWFVDRHWPRERTAQLDRQAPVRSIAGLGSLVEPRHDLPADFPSWQEALETAGRLFQDYRSTLQRRDLGLPPLPDYFDVKRYLSDGITPKTVDRASFGLPLPFYFRSLQGRRATFQPRGCDRLASPLQFRLFPLAAGRIAVLLLNMVQQPGTSLFLGQPMVERGRGRGQERPIPAPDGHLIEQFIAWARNETDRSAQVRTGRW